MFALDDDERVITETAAAFAAKRLAPHALEWDATNHFPVDVLREAAGLGMAAIYCSEDVGGSGLRRLDAVRIFEQLATGDPTTAAFLSIHNMCAWMVDCYGTIEQRKAWVPRLASMEARASYCLDRALRGIRCGGIAHQGGPRRDRLRTRRRQAVHLRRRLVGRLRRYGPNRRRRSARHLCVHRRKRHTRAEFRCTGAQDGLARPADRAGDPRGPPGARGRAAGRRRRRGHPDSGSR